MNIHMAWIFYFVNINKFILKRIFFFIYTIEGVQSESNKKVFFQIERASDSEREKEYKKDVVKKILWILFSSIC